MDFGTSKLIQPDSLFTTTILATPAYASPEQLRNEPVTTVCDIYALGVILFELLAGRRPGDKASIAAMIERAMKEQEPGERLQYYLHIHDDGNLWTPAPTGVVSFLDGTTSLGTANLNGSGVATFSTTSLAVGAYGITASYAGNSNNAASVSAAVAVTVTAPAPNFTLSL